MRCRDAPARRGRAHGRAPEPRRHRGSCAGWRRRGRSRTAGRPADGRAGAASGGTAGRFFPRRGLRARSACQRAKRLAWPGRSSSAALRAASRRPRLAASIGSSGEGGGGRRCGSARPGNRMRGAACAGTTRWASAEPARGGSKSGRAIRGRRLHRLRRSRSP